MTCSICWEEMDMADYNDSLESTLTCFKLECGHAYHTKCIIMSLSKTKHQCPLCNKEKSIQDKVEEQAYIKKILKQVSRLPSIKQIKQEIYIAKKEFRDIVKKLNDDVKEYATKKAIELSLPEKRKYLLNSISTGKKLIREEFKGNNLITSLLFYKQNNWSATICDIFLCPEAKSYWILQRLKNPRLYIKINVKGVSKHGNEYINSDSNGDDNHSIHTLL
jgi:hypothetical protein